MLRTLSMLALVLPALAAAACGGDDGAGNDEGPDRAQTPAAQTCPPQAEEALDDAAFAMKSDDFDGALATVRPYLDCPKVQRREARMRTIAAATTLRVARARLAESERHDNSEYSPQPAVSLARNSLRYEETAEARAFLKKAEAALARFKERYGPKPDEEPGGPPPGAGEGGPPDK